MAVTGRPQRLMLCRRLFVRYRLYFCHPTGLVGKVSFGICHHQLIPGLELCLSGKDKAGFDSITMILLFVVFLKSPLMGRSGYAYRKSLLLQDDAVDQMDH